MSGFGTYLSGPSSTPLRACGRPAMPASPYDEFDTTNLTTKLKKGQMLSGDELQMLRQANRSRRGSRPGSAASSRGSRGGASSFGYGSSIGEQRNGRFVTEPAYSMGQARKGAEAPKLFISKDISDTAGLDSPGPVYPAPYSPHTQPRSSPAHAFPKFICRDDNPFPARLGPPHILNPSSFGEQKETHKPSTGGYSFATEKRHTYSEKKDNRDSDAYTIPGLGDVQYDSLRRTSTAVGMSRARRFYDMPVLKMPGPGEYKVTRHGATGRQTTSRYPTQPVNKFGRSTRASRASLPMPADDSPGPVHDVKGNAAFGRQLLSRRPGSAHVPFSMARRFPKEVSHDVPGPGAYRPV